MEKYGQLFESVFKRKLTDDSTAGYLENITKEHPYFSIAQFYLLSLSQKDVNGYKAQAKKTTVLFNNNHWLNFQLLEAGFNNQSPALERSATEQQPVFGNTYDKVLSEEKMEEPAEKIIEEQYNETITAPADEQQVIEPIEEKTGFNWQEITIEKPVEEINIPVVEETVPVIEEQPVEEVNTAIVEQAVPVIEEEPQLIEEPLAEPAEEVIIPVAEEINIPVVEDTVTAIEETQQPIEEPVVEPVEEITIPVAEEINIPVVEETVTAMEEAPQLIEEPVAEPAEEVIIPVAEEINIPVVEETVAAMEDIQQPIDEPVVEAAEEISTPEAEERKQANEKLIDPAAASMKVKAEPVNEPLLFEPLHTTDYFASVGIKLSEEERTSGSLGKQLKSFTEWLKSMKKVHAAQLAQTSNAAQVEANNTENSIQNLAEKSNQENDVITEAMADVLLQQGRQGKAIEILEKLSLLNPGKSAYFAAKINQIKEK